MTAVLVLHVLDAPHSNPTRLQLEHAEGQYNHIHRPMNRGGMQVGGKGGGGGGGWGEGSASGEVMHMAVRGEGQLCAVYHLAMDCYNMIRYNAAWK